MPMLWKESDWGIYRAYGEVHCLRHMPCENEEGNCACGGYCESCKVYAPDEVRGFFALVEWEK